MKRLNPKNILVIKLGALGDFLQACGPMAAIRAHHPEAHITLLTSDSYRALAERCPYVDDIFTDLRPKFYNFLKIRRMRRFFNQGVSGEGFDRVYDLQNNDRSNFYFTLLPKKTRPEWVGTAKGASHRNTSPERTAGHAFDGHVQTLSLAGITDISVDPLAWMDDSIDHLDIPEPYVVLVPGASPAHPGKRWPAESYGRLAMLLHSDGYTPVVVGTAQEEVLAEEIISHCPAAIDLTGYTTLFELAALARGAAGAVGNDTGPMHLIAATNTPCLTLFSMQSDPVRHQPKGLFVRTLRSENLETLNPEKVFRYFTPRKIRSKPKAERTIH